MTLIVSRTSKGCSSDEVVLVLQKMLDRLYLPNANREYVESLDEARSILLGTQPSVYGFMKNLVNQLEEDDALAMLAEIDHRLTFHDLEFQFNYDVESVGHSEEPYTLFLSYGDPALGHVRMSVNDL